MKIVQTVNVFDLSGIITGVGILVGIIMLVPAIITAVAALATALAICMVVLVSAAALAGVMLTGATTYQIVQRAKYLTPQIQVTPEEWDEYQKFMRAVNSGIQVPRAAMASPNPMIRVEAKRIVNDIT